MPRHFDITQPLPWETSTMARRRSSMTSRRNSLLSMSLFDIPLFGNGGGTGSNRNSLGLGSNMMGFHDSDPFAPLSISDMPLPLTSSNYSLQRPNSSTNDLNFSNGGFNINRNATAITPNSATAPTTLDRLLGDRSESSGSTAPTVVTASSYGSIGTSGFLSQQSALHHKNIQQFHPFSSNLNQFQQLHQQQQRRLSNAFDQIPRQQLKPVHIMSSPQPSSKGVTPEALALSPLSPMKSIENFQTNQLGTLMQNQQPLISTPADTSSSAVHDDDDDDDDEMNQHRFKPFHEEKWSLRYKELLEFHKEHGHAAVPHTYPPNPQLARWVKRQRRQYKLRKENRQSTMTTERLDMLNSVGFIWDSHDVNWREKLDSLQQFRREHGHCNVPSNYRDKKLATWVKCQRRQYKLYWDGKPSAMTPDRIMELEKVGFEWEIRSTVPRNAVSAANRALESTQIGAPGSVANSSDQGSGQEDYSLLYQTISDL